MTTPACTESILCDHEHALLKPVIWNLRYFSVLNKNISNKTTMKPFHLKCPLLWSFLRLLIMDVAAGLKMPVIWTLTLQQWVPQVYHSTLSTAFFVRVCAYACLFSPHCSCLPHVIFGDDLNQKQIFDVSLLFSLREIIVSADLQPFLLSDPHQSLPQLIKSSFSALC